MSGRASPTARSVFLRSFRRCGSAAGSSTPILELIINVARWSSVCLTVLSLGVLLWLLVNGRWTHAMLLAAFIIPILVQAAPRWRLLLGPLSVLGGELFAIAPDLLSQGIQPGNRSGRRGSIDPELVEQCAAVLKAYLEQTSGQVGYTPKGISFERRSANGSTNDSPGCCRMSIEEARDVLGLRFLGEAV